MIQSSALRILGSFIDRETVGFAEMCKNAGYPTDLGGYYIRQLAAGGYLEKVDRGQYRLLPKGKQEMAINYGRRMLAPRPRLAIIVVAKQGDSYCVIRRKIQPFIGTVEWPAGMIVGGETVPAAVERIGQERFGMRINARLVGFFRRIDRYNDAIFDDKLFAIHACDLPADMELPSETAKGENYMLTAADIKDLEKPSRSLVDILRYADAADSSYEEHVYDLTQVDLSLSDQ